MIASSPSNSAHTSRPITLWVEDEITKEYLLKLWQPEDQFCYIRIAGPKDVVRGLVHDERLQGKRNIFGLVDRDFGKSNREKWKDLNPELGPFCPSVFELENFLLSWEALEQCSENQRLFKRTRNEIESRAKRDAEKMVWWMACRSVISGFRDLLVGNFIAHPTIENISSETEAINFITNNAWYQNLSSTSATILQAESVAQRLQAAHTLHSNQFSSGTWVREFPGKEIYHRLRGYIYESNLTDDPDVDLAKSIAEWQVANTKIPEELVELKNSILKRVFPHRR